MTPSPADQALNLLNQHRHILATVLQSYAEDMERAARENQTAYDRIKDDPQAVAAQDRSIITTEGLRISAERFAANADQARAAHTALADFGEDYSTDKPLQN